MQLHTVVGTDFISEVGGLKFSYASSIPELGRAPGEGNGNQLQYSCLENPIDRGAWQSTVHGVTKELDTWTQNSELQFCVHSVGILRVIYAH